MNAGGAVSVDPRRALVPQPQWCSWLDLAPEPCLPEHRDAFRLSFVDNDVAIDAAGDPGRYYAERMAEQLRVLHPDGVPDLVTVDWPDLDHRGVMLDCSRNRIPTIETLDTMFATFGGMRINHVELYLETTFQHLGHDDIWGDRDAYSLDDVRRLCRSAAAHHIELIGQQNSLGHLEGWLASERFEHLAVLPGGYHAPDDGGHEPPACLDPANPESWALASELVSNMAEAFDQQRMHVGLDEPIDMNPAVWDAIFDVPGAIAPWAEVDDGSFCVPLPPDRREQYVDWIHRLRELPALNGRNMLMWADVMAPHPELLDRLPDGITLVEWGYEGPHAFHARCARIARAGRPFWVAPGTAGWTSISGRIDNMIVNVDAALDAAVTHGGCGLLITSWGTLPSVSDWPGFAWAAAGAWNNDRRPELAAALDLGVAHDLGVDHTAGLGDIWVALGTIHRLITPTIPETGTVSALFTTSGMAGIGLVLNGMTTDQLDAVDAELSRIDAQLDELRREPAPGRLVVEELRWVQRALTWGVSAARHRLGWPMDADAEWLRSEHAWLRSEHERLWHARNRHGGYDDTAAELAGTLGGI